MEGDLGSAGTIGLTLGLSLLHAVIPSHWLPFVLVGRSLRWTRRRTLLALAAAGGLHVVITSGLGIAVWWFGAAAIGSLDPERVEHLGARIGGSVLGLLGLIYLGRHLLGGHGHSHAHGRTIYAHEHHEHGDHDHGHDAHGAPAIPERGAVLMLFAAVTLSPCGAVVAAFLTGVRFGLDHVLALAIASSVTTVLVMFVLTWLTLAGMEKLRFPWLDRNEMAITGAILVGIGVLVLLVPS